MDAAWIQIFVLTMAECVAPAGKTICQEREFDLQFLTRADCEYALEQLVALKEASATVIVNKSKSSCAPSARQADVFASLEAVGAASGDKSAWRAPKDDESTSTSHVSHQERLVDMPSCEESDGVAPCKSGEIIIEAETQEEAVEVWRRDP